MSSIMTPVGYQKFIVLSAPRSGSNHLIHLLDNHPNIICYGEPFQPNFLLGNPRKTFFENPLIFYIYRHVRNRYPLFFLKHIIFGVYHSRIRAVGFKIFYEHAQEKLLRSVWSFLQESPNLKIIHLERKNILRSYVSLQIALETGEFISYSKSKSAEQSKIILEYTECKKYFLATETWRNMYESFFSHQKMIRIYYEDLYKTPQKVLRRVQQFLEISPRALTSPLIKQNTKPLSQTIANYSQLKRQFASSPWKSFFEE